MWKRSPGKHQSKFVVEAANLMRDPEAFRRAMQAALIQWPSSCIHNLSAKNTNRRAWLGHAGCFLVTGSPESTTRLGWHELSLLEQDIADTVAQQVIDEWECDYWGDKSNA